MLCLHAVTACWSASADQLQLPWEDLQNQLNTGVFGVPAGEMGSLLQNKDDLSYYDSIAQYTQMNTAEDGSESPLVGWIWWAYNANSAGETLLRTVSVAQPQLLLQGTAACENVMISDVLYVAFDCCLEVFGPTSSLGGDYVDHPEC